jgi:hypothetical protein
MRRRLVLDRETVAELTTDELVLAAGGLSGPTCVGMTCPAGYCLTQRLGCWDLTNTC